MKKLPLRQPILGGALAHRLKWFAVQQCSSTSLVVNYSSTPDQNDLSNETVNNERDPSLYSNGRIKNKSKAWLQAPESRKLQQELNSLTLVPFGQKANLNELEKQDQEMKRQLKLFKTSVKMKVYKPRTPSLRWWRYPVYPYLHKSGPVWQLTVPKKQHSGRNNTGRITVRGRGGGFKRRLRLVDFYRLESGEHNVERIEFDPNRSGHIALIKHKETGALSYILACAGLRAGDTVESFRHGIPQRIIEKMGGQNDPGIFASHTAKKGNCLPLNLIPLGTIIHNIGISKIGPAKFCRSAGTFGRLFEKLPEKNRAVVRLQSGELRYVALEACATIGMVSNPDHQHISLGKAGRARNLGWRPIVRGVAQNKCDHPLGGGRGKSKSNKIPVSPWGVIAKSGYKTRRGKKQNRMKIVDRPRGKAKR